MKLRLQKRHSLSISLSLSHFQQVRGGGTQKSGVSRAFPSRGQHDDFGCCWLLFAGKAPLLGRMEFDFLQRNLATSTLQFGDQKRSKFCADMNI